MFGSLYINNRFFIALGALAFIFVMAFIWPFILFLGFVMLGSLLVFVLYDLYILYHQKNAVSATRKVSEQLSLGDVNHVVIEITNNSREKFNIELVDELPYQLQIRNFSNYDRLNPYSEKEVSYTIRPTERGGYEFGNINVFLKSRIQLLERRQVIKTPMETAVYPSIIQMKKYELRVFNQTARRQGIKKIRKLGRTNEFEQIKNYVQGDDYRTINWKATSRRREIMVNQYQDERSQNVFCIIDKSRAMRLPFNGMTLLDYSINSALIMANTAIKKGDKAGLMSFSNKMETRLPAGSGTVHLRKIMESLYRQETDFLEADYEMLYYGVRKYIKGRSLVLLYTNFESIYAIKRAIPILRGLNKLHLLLVVFFENSELEDLTKKPADSINDIYYKTIAEKFAVEKNLIIQELNNFGIQAILSRPENLNVDTINKYLELKSRGMI